MDPTEYLLAVRAGLRVETTLGPGWATDEVRCASLCVAASEAETGECDAEKGERRGFWNTHSNRSHPFP